MFAIKLIYYKNISKSWGFGVLGKTINLGNYANDGTGDDLRVAFTKVNANFAALDASAAIANGVNVGTGIGIFFAKDTTNLQFKSLTSTNSSVTISSTGNTVDLAAVTRLQSDPAPTLGANLNLNNKYVYGGDIQSTVYGYNVPITTNFNSLLVESNNFNIDLGSFLTPTGYETDGLAGKKGYLLDWGLFSDAPVNDKLNFGSFADHLTGGIGQLTIAGNLTTTGAYNLTLATTGNTSLTLPTSGTLTTTANNLSAFAATTSAQLLSVISDETGTGALVFATNPVLVTPTIGAATAISLTFSDTSVQSTAWLGTAAAGTLTGTTLKSTVITSSLTSVGTLTGLTVGGNLTITGTSRQVIGDFDNATVANRTLFKTATTNASTGIYAVPNGTNTGASWQAANNVDPTNASKILIATNGSTDVQLVSGINGTGTYLPLSFYTNGSQKMQLTTGGNLSLTGNYIHSINASVTAAGNAVQASATALTTDVNILTTVTAGTATGVALPTGIAGMVIFIYNSTATAANIYPVNGGTASINALGNNAAYSLAGTTGARFVCASSTKWYTI